MLLWTFAPLHHESGTRVRGVIYNANTISSRQCVQAVSCHQAHTSCYKVRAMHKLHKQEYGGGYPIPIEVYFVKLVSDDGG